MKTRIMISAAVIAAGMLASCSNKEIVDEQPEIDGVSACTEYCADSRHGHEGRLRAENRMGGK